MRVRKKPVEVDAEQWTDPKKAPRCVTFVRCRQDPAGADVYEGIIETLEGNMVAMLDDWIVKGVKGEFYPVKPDIFSETYDIIDVPQN